MSEPSTSTTDSTNNLRLMKGIKQFVPDNSWIQKWQLENAIKQQEFALGTERMDLSRARLKANWDHENKKAVVYENVGKTLETFGHTTQGITTLESEEALYLLETNLLELFYYNVPMSIQQAYALIINDDELPLEIYRAYSTLINKGFRLIRNNFLNNPDEISPDLDINNIDLENMEFPFIVDNSIIPTEHSETPLEQNKNDVNEINSNLKTNLDSNESSDISNSGTQEIFQNISIDLNDDTQSNNSQTSLISLTSGGVISFTEENENNKKDVQKSSLTEENNSKHVQISSLTEENESNIKDVQKSSLTEENNSKHVQISSLTEENESNIKDVQKSSLTEENVNNNKDVQKSSLTEENNSKHVQICSLTEENESNIKDVQKSSLTEENNSKHVKICSLTEENENNIKDVQKSSLTEENNSKHVQISSLTEENEKSNKDQISLESSLNEKNENNSLHVELSLESSLTEENKDIEAKISSTQEKENINKQISLDSALIQENENMTDKDSQIYLNSLAHQNASKSPKEIQISEENTVEPIKECSLTNLENRNSTNESKDATDSNSKIDSNIPEITDECQTINSHEVETPEVEMDFVEDIISTPSPNIRNLEINSMIVVDSISPIKEMNHSNLKDNVLNKDNSDEFMNTSLDPSSMDIDDMIVLDSITPIRTKNFKRNSASANDISNEKENNSTPMDYQTIKERYKNDINSSISEKIINQEKVVAQNAKVAEENFIVIDSIESDDDMSVDILSENSTSNSFFSNKEKRNSKMNDKKFQKKIQEIDLDAMEETSIHSANDDNDEDITIIHEFDISDDPVKIENNVINARSNEEDKSVEDDDSDEDSDDSCIWDSSEENNDDILDINLRDHDVDLLNREVLEPVGPLTQEIEIIDIPVRKVPIITLDSDDDSEIEELATATSVIDEDSDIQVIDLSTEESDMEEENSSDIPVHWNPLPKIPLRQNQTSDELMNKWKNNSQWKSDILKQFFIFGGPFRQKAIPFPDKSLLPSSFQHIPSKTRQVNWYTVTEKAPPISPENTFKNYEFWNPPWVEPNRQPVEKKRPFNRATPLEDGPNQNANSSFWFQYGNFFRPPVKLETPHQFFKPEMIQIDQKPNILIEYNPKNQNKNKRKRKKKNSTFNNKRIKVEQIKTESHESPMSILVPGNENSYGNQAMPNNFYYNPTGLTSNMNFNMEPTNLNNPCVPQMGATFNLPPAFVTPRSSKRLYKKMFSMYSPGKPFRKSNPGIPDGHLIFTSGETRPEETLTTIKHFQGNVPLILSVFHDHSLSFFSLKQSQLVPWTPNQINN